MTKRFTDADPESNRAKLRARIRERFGRRDGEPDLADLISGSFSYLVAEFGYEETEARGTGWNNTTTLKEYVLPDRKIGIWAGGFDNGSFCGIFFQQTGPSVADRGCRVHEFRTLISARDPNFTHPRYAESVETAKRHIRNYAKALRVFAKDAILGDYSFFER